jgi:hypothetical protein
MPKPPHNPPPAPPKPHPPVEGCLDEKNFFYTMADGTTERSDRQMAAVVHNLNLLTGSLAGLQTSLQNYQPLEEKNQPDGYPGLDEAGKLPACLIPDLAIPVLHNQLQDRNLPDCHPVGAVTGLPKIIEDTNTVLAQLRQTFDGYVRKDTGNVIGGWPVINTGGKIDEAFLPELLIPSTTDHIVTARDWTLRGTDVGGWHDGDTIPQGTSLTDLLTVMFTQAFPPQYDAPLLTLTSAPAEGYYEIGTTLTPLLEPLFTAGDAGSVTGYRLYRNGVPVYDNIYPAPLNQTVQTTDVPQEFFAAMDYAEGPVKNDSLGEPSPDGRIPAGTLTSNILTFRGLRMMFAGGSAETAAPNVSGLVRAYPSLFPQKSFSFSVPDGTQQILIAYPASEAEVSSIWYEAGAASGEYKELFTLRSVPVEGAEGYAPAAYRVYYWTLAVPALASMTFQITIP